MLVLRDRGQAREASVFVEAVVEVERVVEAGATPLQVLPNRPTRFAVAEQLVQRNTNILLIKLLSIIRAAGIPAVTAQRRIMARHTQLVHRAIHRLKQLVRGSLV